MPSFARARIRIGDSESRVIEKFEIAQHFFTGPGAFAARVGHSGVIADLRKIYRPGMPFTVSIDLPNGQSVPQMTGRLDASNPEQSSGGDELTLRGRDWTMPLHDSMPKVERAWSSTTFAKLTEDVIRITVPDFSLSYSDRAKVAAISGVPKFETRKVEAPIQNPQVIARLKALRLKQTGVPLALTEKEFVDASVLAGYDCPNPLRAKTGETWLSFLQKELNRAGLFLIADIDEKNYILTQPDGAQAPTFRFVRKAGDTYGIVAARFRDDTAHRHSHYIVHGRAGDATTGRKQVTAEYVDQEMVDAGLIKPWSHPDKTAKTSQQADFLARRQCAEDRRSGWELSYTIRGLTWPIRHSPDQEAVPSVNMTAEIIDEVYGISGTFWIEGTSPRGDGRADGSTTEIAFIRPSDLIFGEDVVLDPKPAKKRHP